MSRILGQTIRHRFGAASILAATLAMLVASGCHHSDRAELPPEPGVPSYIDHDILPGHVQSASILPLGNDTSYPTVGEAMTSALYAALLQRQIFQVVTVPAADASAEAAGADPGHPLSLKDLARMRKALGTDVVVLGAVNHFEPYPHMKIGLTVRIVDLRDGRVAWAINHVWDAADKDTQRRMAEYFHNELGKDYEPIDWRMATLSPASFEKFVAWEMGTTLPGLGQMKSVRGIAMSAN